MASEAQIERMEKELNKVRLGLGESVQIMEQKEMAVNLEYEQLCFRSGELREELHTELERILKTVVDFKIHVQTSLESFEEFVAEEVEREYEEMEQEEGDMGKRDEMEE